MAKTFLPSTYFKSVVTTALLEEFYTILNIEGFVQLSDQMPRKTQIDTMVEHYNSLSIDEKYKLIDIFSVLTRISTKVGGRVLIGIAKERIKENENLSEFVGSAPGDFALYFYMHHPTIIHDAIMLTEMYETKGYVTYPTTVGADINKILSNQNTFQEEFARVSAKETRGRFSAVTIIPFDGRLHIVGSFEDAPRISAHISHDDGMVYRDKLNRPLKEIFMVYHSDRGEIDVKYSGPVPERIALTECFLRTMLDTTLDTKAHMYELSLILDNNFTLNTAKYSHDLVSWRLTSLGILYQEGKRGVKLSAPKGRSITQEAADMQDMLDRMQIPRGSISITSATFTFVFIAGESGDKTIKINATVTKDKCSLGNFSKEERLAKSILQDSGIDLGFVDIVEGYAANVKLLDDTTHSHSNTITAIEEVVEEANTDGAGEIAGEDNMSDISDTVAVQRLVNNTAIIDGTDLGEEGDVDYENSRDASPISEDVNEEELEDNLDGDTEESGMEAEEDSDVKDSAEEVAEGEVEDHKETELRKTGV